jgi:hypothetical protein
MNKISTAKPVLEFFDHTDKCILLMKKLCASSRKLWIENELNWLVQLKPINRQIKIFLGLYPINLKIKIGYLTYVSLDCENKAHLISKIANSKGFTVSLFLSFTKCRTEEGVIYSQLKSLSSLPIDQIFLPHYFPILDKKNLKSWGMQKVMLKLGVQSDCKEMKKLLKPRICHSDENSSILGMTVGEEMVKVFLKGKEMLVRRMEDQDNTHIQEFIKITSSENTKDAYFQLLPNSVELFSTPLTEDSSESFIVEQCPKREKIFNNWNAEEISNYLSTNSFPSVERVEVEQKIGWSNNSMIAKEWWVVCGQDKQFVKWTNSNFVADFEGLYLVNFGALGRYLIFFNFFPLHFEICKDAKEQPPSKEIQQQLIDLNVFDENALSLLVPLSALSHVAFENRDIQFLLYMDCGPIFQREQKINCIRSLKNLVEAAETTKFVVKIGLWEIIDDIGKYLQDLDKFIGSSGWIETLHILNHNLDSLVLPSEGNFSLSSFLSSHPSIHTLILQHCFAHEYKLFLLLKLLEGFPNILQIKIITWILMSKKLKEYLKEYKIKHFSKLIIVEHAPLSYYWSHSWLNK